MARCNIIDRYCREVKGVAKSIGSYGPFLAERLRYDLEEFLEEHPNATEAELRQHFGDPKSYILEYSSTMDPQEQKQYITDSRFKRRLWLSTIAAILAVIFALALWIGTENSRQAVDYYVNDITEGTTSPIQEG